MARCRDPGPLPPIFRRNSGHGARGAHPVRTWGFLSFEDRYSAHQRPPRETRCRGRPGHLLGNFCTSGNGAVLHRGTVGNDLLLHFTSQLVYHLIADHSCAGRHQRSPRKFWLAAACFKLLVKGTIIFQKRHRFQKPVMPR